MRWWRRAERRLRSCTSPTSSCGASEHLEPCCTLHDSNPDLLCWFHA